MESYVMQQCYTVYCVPRGDRRDKGDLKCGVKEGLNLLAASEGVLPLIEK